MKDEGPVGAATAGGGLEVPPLLTSLPPRHAHTLQPRSPVSSELLAGSALSPSFSPALSPLATRSPSISPLGVVGAGPAAVVRGGGVARASAAAPQRYQSAAGALHSDYVDAENELRI